MAGARSLLHDKVAWAVTMFFALQSAGFYATLAWLPSVFHSHGASSSKSGLLLSISLIVGLIPALTVPTMAARSARPASVRVGVCGVSSPRAGSG